MRSWIVDPWYRFWCDCVFAVHRRKIQHSVFHRGLFGLCEWKIFRSRGHPVYRLHGRYIQRCKWAAVLRELCSEIK